MSKFLFDFNTLIIDDSEIDRYILARQLKQLGISQIAEHASAKSAKDYLVALREQQAGVFPKLLIVDMHMPLMGGVELLRDLRPWFDSGPLQSAQVLMYSASEAPEEQAEAMALPMVKGFLVKGASIEQLQQSLSKL
ncbi:response regulator [Alteromonas sp. ASW11-36]|uniref:Response regulator n=1 Tax=Alteromonas arenosi TaxID=3055817 RepID=A0ABT7T0Y1_9ALTE|nr:response regulator [Alteromonas sp. ASW11-36]MDM7862106.1 response regulator [Alteromonas sp. ASW11-36]